MENVKFEIVALEVDEAGSRFEDQTNQKDTQKERQQPRSFLAYLQSLKEIVIANFLVFGFSCAFLIALTFPLPGTYLSAQKLTSTTAAGKFEMGILEFINNFLVFLISGLSLRSEDLKSLWDKKFILLYGILTINFLTTLVAFIMIRLPFKTRPFSVGLAIFSTVPTTLGVGVALTLAAKGDQALALMLTIFSNMLGTVTVPFLLALYLGSSTGNSIDPVNLLYRLTLTVLVPSVAGILLRRYSTTISSVMKQYKVEMGLFSNSNLICIVWMSVSKSRELIIHQSGSEIVLVTIAAVVMHVFYLLANTFVAKHLLKFQLPSAIAIIIMCSQKSSPVALAVITNLGSGGKSQSGLLTIPCVIGQLSQIFIGSFVAKHFAVMIDDAERKLKLQTEAEAEGELVDEKEGGQQEGEGEEEGLKEEDLKALVVSDNDDKIKQDTLAEQSNDLTLQELP